MSVKYTLMGYFLCLWCPCYALVLMSNRWNQYNFSNLHGLSIWGHRLILILLLYFLLSLVLNLAYIEYSLFQIWSVYMQYLRCCDHSNKCLFFVRQQAQVLLNFLVSVYGTAVLCLSIPDMNSHDADPFLPAWWLHMLDVQSAQSQQQWFNRLKQH